MKKTHRLQRGGMAAFSLVEVTLALGIAAFCLAVLLGLIVTGVNSDQLSLEQTAASGLAAAVAADLRATANTANTASPRYGLTISNAAGSLAQPETIYLAEDGSATGAVGAAPVTTGDTPSTPVSRYRVSLAFTDPPPGKGPTGVRLLVSWPALADADPSKVPKNYADALEVVTALDRN